MSRRNYKATSSRRGDLEADGRRQERDEEHGATAALVMSSQNAVDQGDCEHLAAHPMADDAARGRAESHLAWLRANPFRCLVFGIRRRLEAMLRALDIQKERAARGLPLLPPRARRPRPQPWERAPRPAWMADPSLLPKRPPGKV